MRFTGEEISNLDAISLSNCPKLSDEPRIKRLSTPLPKSERNHLFIRNFSLERAII